MSLAVMKHIKSYLNVRYRNKCHSRHLAPAKASYSHVSLLHLKVFIYLTLSGHYIYMQHAAAGSGDHLGITLYYAISISDDTEEPLLQAQGLLSRLKLILFHSNF